MRMIGMLVLLLLVGCGDGGNVPSGGNGLQNRGAVDPPPVILNSVELTCLDVDNDQTCDAPYDMAGFFNSGEVRISGSPMPHDYMNLEITSSLNHDASVFVYSNVEVAGCLDQELASDVFDISPGETVSFSGALMGYRCGVMGLNESQATIYNASHFNPPDYLSVYDYPRDQAISNAVVRWENVGAGG